MIFFLVGWNEQVLNYITIEVEEIVYNCGVYLEIQKKELFLRNLQKSQKYWLAKHLNNKKYRNVSKTKKKSLNEIGIVFAFFSTKIYKTHLPKFLVYF